MGRGIYVICLTVIALTAMSLLANPVVVSDPVALYSCLTIAATCVGLLAGGHINLQIVRTKHELPKENHDGDQE